MVVQKFTSRRESRNRAKREKRQKKRRISIPFTPAVSATTVHHHHQQPAPSVTSKCSHPPDLSTSPKRAATRNQRQPQETPPYRLRPATTTHSTRRHHIEPATTTPCKRYLSCAMMGTTTSVTISSKHEKNGPSQATFPTQDHLPNNTKTKPQPNQYYHHLPKTKLETNKKARKPSNQKTHQLHPIRLMHPILHRLINQLGVRRRSRKSGGEDGETLEVEYLCGRARASASEATEQRAAEERKRGREGERASGRERDRSEVGERAESGRAEEMATGRRKRGRAG